MAGDATRATLIALGLTLVGQACGGDAETSNERDGVGLIPPYGLGPFPDDTGGGGDGGSGGAAGSGGRDPGPTVPPYGAMPPPEPGGGSGGDAETPDSGAPPDAGGDDAGASETPDAGD